ncbi:MAG: CotH kinase family protein [Myxococcota bacterium]
MRSIRGWGYRLYKISLPSALVLCAPIFVAVIWYAWTAFAQLDRYRRTTEPGLQIDGELLQIFLHDELTRDLRRFVLKDRPAESRLPTFELSIPRHALDALDRDPVREGKGSYVKAFLRKDGVMHSVRLRYRGRKHWHRLGAQKSMKIRVDKGDLVDGVRIFNLINDVTPFGLEEEVILALARDHGLMTPEVEPVWLRVNNGDMGVYRYQAQPAEGLIRRSRRMPGSIYSGNSDATDEPGGIGALFGNIEGWRKAAWKTAREQDDYTELNRLLYAVRLASHREFRAFAREELDLERFALFDALDVIFGGDQHDFLSNHKLYFDPYRGRFEPIAWNFRAFTNDPRFNLTENPLLLRLKALPDFVRRRDRMVHELLLGDASVPAIRAHVDARFADLSPELAADP